MSILLDRDSRVLVQGITAHVVFVGSAFIFLTVLALNYLGDAVRARFDVREAAI